jgi:hypothetical protein
MKNVRFPVNVPLKQSIEIWDNISRLNFLYILISLTFRYDMYKSVPRNTFYWTKCVHDLHINKAIHSDPPMWSHSIPKQWWLEPVLYFLVLPVISYVYMQTYIYICIQYVCTNEYIYIWCKNIHMINICIIYIIIYMCVWVLYIYSVFIYI